MDRADLPRVDTVTLNFLLFSSMFARHKASDLPKHQAERMEGK